MNLSDFISECFAGMLALLQMVRASVCYTLVETETDSAISKRFLYSSVYIVWIALFFSHNYYFYCLPIGFQYLWLHIWGNSNILVFLLEVERQCGEGGAVNQNIWVGKPKYQSNRSLFYYIKCWAAVCDAARIFWIWGWGEGGGNINKIFNIFRLHLDAFYYH